MNLMKRSLSNAVINIMRNKVINFLCLGIIAFTLLIFGIFNYVSFSLESFSAQFTKGIEAIFYFKDNVDQKKIDALIDQMRDSLLVDHVTFVSKNQAEAEFSRLFPDLKYVLTEFDNPPFPASMEVKFKIQEKIDTKINAFIEDIEQLKIVESTQVNIDWAKKILAYKQFLSFIGIFLSSILIFISVFIIYNVIKLNIFYRKEEINILKLVGATDWYIRFPFVIEGALLGFFGSVMASALLYSALKLLPTFSIFKIDFIKEMFNFSIIPLDIFIQMVILGTGIGLFSALFSIKKYLKN
jgi:cell division transport system permease protein